MVGGSEKVSVSMNVRKLSNRPTASSLKIIRWLESIMRQSSEFLRIALIFRGFLKLIRI